MTKGFMVALLATSAQSIPSTSGSDLPHMPWWDSLALKRRSTHVILDLAIGNDLLPDHVSDFGRKGEKSWSHVGRSKIRIASVLCLVVMRIEDAREAGFAITVQLGQAKTSPANGEYQPVSDFDQRQTAVIHSPGRG